MNIQKIREDFPILKRKVKGKQLIYLDNAATSQKPNLVIDAINDYYTTYNANIHRGIHKLSEEATLAFEEAHEKVARLINATMPETIFTKGTSESLNILSYILRNNINPGDEIVISQMEHHSNIVPWQMLAKERRAKLKLLKIDDDGKLDCDEFSEIITNKTKIVSIVHMSNVLGVINPIKEIAKIAHDNGALCITDAAQSVPQMPVDVKALGVDFMAFSGHKMLGPTGTGVLFGKKHLLEELPPFLTGGDMITEVTFEKATWNKLPWKYEAGTPNIAGGIGLGYAVDYLRKLGMENIEDYEKKLSKKASEILSDVSDLELHGSLKEKRSVFSFNLKGIHAHDVASLLDDSAIAIRAGHHCAMPLMGVLGLNSSARASLYLYNTVEEIEKLAVALEKVKKVFA